MIPHVSLGYLITALVKCNKKNKETKTGIHRAIKHSAALLVLYTVYTKSESVHDGAAIKVKIFKSE